MVPMRSSRIAFVLTVKAGAILELPGSPSAQVTYFKLDRVSFFYLVTCRRRFWKSYQMS